MKEALIGAILAIIIFAAVLGGMPWVFKWVDYNQRLVNEYFKQVPVSKEGE